MTILSTVLSAAPIVTQPIGTVNTLPATTEFVENSILNSSRFIMNSLTSLSSYTIDGMLFDTLYLYNIDTAITISCSIPIGKTILLLIANTSQTITWNPSIQWPNGTAPIFTGTNYHMVTLTLINTMIFGSYTLNLR